VSGFVEWIGAQADGPDPAASGLTRPDQDWDRDPDLWLYRKKTTALLRRYMRWSLEAGRVPSLLGRELFRARISAFTATTFEARVIFLHDVERCLDRLQGFDRQIIARVVLQEYDHEAAARILQCTRRTLLRRLPDLIDELSEAFLKAELLERLPETREETV
jgi:DNA-directed RNA polymerase specialized sigma24 family protein